MHKNSFVSITFILFISIISILGILVGLSDRPVLAVPLPEITPTPQKHTPLFQQSADLVVFQTNEVDKLYPKQTVTYTLIISNTGNEPAMGVVLTDILPLHSNLIGASHQGSALLPTSGVITWSLPNLAVGATLTRTVIVSIASMLPTGVNTLSNTILINTNSPESNQFNNTMTEITPLWAAPDLVLTKIRESATLAEPGEPITYLLLAENVGTQDTTGVVVTDTLPMETTFSTSSGCSNATINPIEFIWKPNNLAVGQAKTCRLYLTINNPVSAQVMALTNTALITDHTLNGPDLNPANNWATVVTTIESAPDATLTGQTKPLTATRGEYLTYTLHITNIGNRQGSGLTITDTLSAHTTYITDSAILIDKGGSLIIPGEYQTTTHTLLWNTTDLLVNRSLTATWQVVVNPTTPFNVTTLTNTAQVKLQNDEVNKVNNITTIGNTLQVQPVDKPDLAVSKTDGYEFVVSDQQIVYTITISNLGGKVASNIILTDTLPSGITFISASNDGIYNNNIVTWTTPSLLPQTMFKRFLTATVRSEATDLINQVRVTDNGLDINQSNNTAIDISERFTPQGAKQLYLPLILKQYPPLTPTPTPTPDVPCYTDDFNNATSGWVTGNYSEADYSYEPNPNPIEYRIYATEPITVPTARVASPFGYFVNPYTITVDINWNDFPIGDEYGILLGIQDNQDPRVRNASKLHRFVVDTRNTRSYALRGYDVDRPDGWYPEVDWTIDSTNINTDTLTNTLKIACYGSRAKIYINDNLLADELLENSCDGEIGLTASTNNNVNDPVETDARFNNFEVCGNITPKINSKSYVPPVLRDVSTPPN